MKRVLFGILALLMVMVPTRALANACQSKGTCTTAAPCPWSDTNTWSSCGATTPQAADSVLIYPIGTSVIYDMDDQSITSLNLTGELIFDHKTSDRGADGLRTLTVAGDITGYGPSQGGSGGLIMRKNDRLLFDTTAAKRVLQVYDGVNIDLQGDVYQTTLKAATTGNATATCSSVGKEFTLTVNDGASRATVGGRVIFQSGQMLDRQLEIVAVSGNTITVCSDFSDGSSVSARSQRLTPHASLSRTYPTNRHTVPDPGANTECSGSGAPYPWCTGVGTGTGYAITPAAGDKIAIITDWIIGQTGGTQGWRFAPLASFTTPWPKIRAGNVYGFANVGGTVGWASTAASQANPQTGMSYMNIHDYSSASGGVQYLGSTGTTWEWNACHDGTASAGNGPCMSVIQSGSLATSNTAMSHNIGYRNQARSFQIGTGSLTVQGTGNSIDYNLVYDGCLTSTSGQCGAVGIAASRSSHAAGNVVYYLESGAFPDAASGKTGVYTATDYAIILSALSPADLNDTYALRNWVVNHMGIAIGSDAPAQESKNASAVANYISHISSFGVALLSAYGNLIRDYGLLGNGDPPAIQYPPRAAQGNYLLGVEPTIANSADCTTRGCARFGINVGTDASHDSTDTDNITDNVTAALYSNYKVLTAGGNYVGGCYGTFSGSQAGVFNINFDHLTCDGRSYAYNIVADENVNCTGPGAPIACCSGAGAGTCGPQNPDFNLYGIYLTSDCNGGVCSPSVTHNIRDFFGINLNGKYIIQCQNPTSGQTRTLGTVYRLVSGDSANTTASVHDASGSECSSQTAGLQTTSNSMYRSAPSGDYGFIPNATLASAGAYPSGSAIGSRAFAFSRSAIMGPWGGALAFDGEQPVDFSNGTCTGLTYCNQDTDGDGVIDLFDNCVGVWNPSQYDSDGDGKGDECDR